MLRYLGVIFRVFRYMLVEGGDGIVFWRYDGILKYVVCLWDRILEIRWDVGVCGMSMGRFGTRVSINDTAQSICNGTWTLP